MDIVKPLFIATIYGEPASKANQRRISVWRGKIRNIKSAKALSYLDAFRMQCPQLPQLIDIDVEVRLVIHYASRRPDLDESVILDALQGKAYINDRQVRRKVVDWAIDRERPRTYIEIHPLPEGHCSGNQGRRKRRP